MKILLTGATGFIGDTVLRALLQQGHHITACCRKPEKLLIKSENIRPLRLDFAAAHNMEKWLPHLDDIDAVINCVGIIAESKDGTFAQLHSQAPIALFNACERAGIKKIIQISALGADDQAQSAYHLSKKAADDALRQLPLDWFILQPSVVYGARIQTSSSFHFLASLPVHILPDGGLQQLQPIHVDDVAAAVCRCLEPTTPGRKTVALVGPASVTYADYLQRLRQRLGYPPAYTLSITQRYVLLAAAFGTWLGYPVLSKDNVAMLYRGSTAEVGEVTELLGRPPLSIPEQLFEKPASQAERRSAQLYFAKPVLRFAIAVVWLWSGITSLFFYPHELSYQLLAATGISGSAAPMMLYGLALMDIALGLATLSPYRPARLMSWQIGIVLVYTLIVSFTLPEFWLHPFGPILKNIPFLLCLWIYKQLAGEKP